MTKQDRPEKLARLYNLPLVTTLQTTTPRSLASTMNTKYKIHGLQRGSKAIAVPLRSRAGITLCLLHQLWPKRCLP